MSMMTKKDAEDIITIVGIGFGGRSGITQEQYAKAIPLLAEAILVIQADDGQTLSEMAHHTTTFEEYAPRPLNTPTPITRKHRSTITELRPLCYCPAYPGPHEPGVDDCKATGNVTCPACAVVLDDNDVYYRLHASATYYEPEESTILLLQPCGNCGAIY